jgi:hypothetical protein
MSPSTFPQRISSEHLPKLKERTLDPSQADEFLKFLFSTVARRAGMIRLHEGAAVAQCLKELAWRLPAGAGRTHLDRLAWQVWQTTFRVASIKPSGKQKAARFLRRHRGTHFRNSVVGRTLELLEEVDVPDEEIEAAARSSEANLVSERMSIQGKALDHLQDDLSERIYAGYHALRLAGIPGARGRVMQALKAQRLARKGLAGKRVAWDAAAVADRVKQYRDVVRRRFGPKKDQVDKGRNLVVWKWLELFNAPKAMDQGGQDRGLLEG